MSEPVNNPPNFELYRLLAPLAGAVLSILGGFAALYFKGRLEKKQEIEYIKVSLSDEIVEVCSIISKLNETHSKTHTLSNTYLNDLQKNTESFKYHKNRLFLINSSSLRKEIVLFYKELDESISESINKVGTLGETPTGTTHEPLITKLNSVRTKAESLEAKLKKYNYRPHWINSTK